ncbi:hypothetical protein Cni_G03486 [Canna indica]|uniref:Uncharacterized protein n=1 Tax=Canna indica TaxID=4628 RepID=A0AAQ3JTZ8_9LILI|nr:hypothetical protein Cni_G03486 [Canna indica]
MRISFYWWALNSSKDSIMCLTLILVPMANMACFWSCIKQVRQFATSHEFCAYTSEALKRSVCLQFCTVGYLVLMNCDTTQQCSLLYPSHFGRVVQVVIIIYSQ